MSSVPTLPAPPNIDDLLSGSAMFQNLQRSPSLPQSVAPPPGAPTDEEPDQLTQFLKNGLKSKKDLLNEMLGTDANTWNAKNKKERALTIASIVSGGLAGRNFQQDAQQEFENRQSQTTNVIRQIQSQNQLEAALAKVGALESTNKETNRVKEELGKQLNTVKAQNAATAAAKVKQDTDIKEQTNAIRLLTAQSKAGSMEAQQKIAERLQDLKEKYPQVRPESVLIAAHTDKDGNVDGPGVINDMIRIKRAGVRPLAMQHIQGPETTQFSPEGDATGVNRQIGVMNPYSGQMVGQQSMNTPLGPGNLTAEERKGMPESKMTVDLAKLNAANLLNDYSSGQLNQYTGFLKGNKYAQMFRNQLDADGKPISGTTNGEVLNQVLKPDTVITHARQLSPRINQQEIKLLSDVTGTQTQGPEALVRRAMLYSLVREFSQAKKLRYLPDAVANDPVFVREMAGSVNDAVAKGKASQLTGGKAQVTAPTMQDVMSRYQAKKAGAGVAKTPGVAQGGQQAQSGQLDPATQKLLDRYRELKKSGAGK